MNSIERGSITHSPEGNSLPNNRVIDKDNTVVVSKKEHGDRFVDKIKKLLSKNEDKDN